MKKTLLITPVLFMLFLVFPKISFAKTACNMLPGNVQCFRSWCDNGQTKVCKSNEYCYCYGPGEKIAETENNQGDATCTYSKTGSIGINTAIGCVPFENINDFAAFILRWAVGVGGGIAFLLILYGGFMVMSSAGNPERLKAGQELITSALSGLILLIFSVFILKFIGVDILGLGKFGFGQ